jgi:UDP-N-acetylglucosamine 2-epimerase (non-hydrolysing)
MTFVSPGAVTCLVPASDLGRTVSIVVTGNTCIDSLKYIILKKEKFLNKTLCKKIPLDKKIILVTAHRRENFDKPLKGVLNALKRIAKKYKDVFLILFILSVTRLTN